MRTGVAAAGELRASLANESDVLCLGQAREAREHNTQRERARRAGAVRSCMRVV